MYSAPRLSRRKAAGLMAALPAAAQQNARPFRPFRFGDGRDWFFEKRFGLFIHWGIYAVGAWHEQHLYRRGLTRAEYAPFARQFHPVKFDPDRWLDLAGEAGMEYVCFTTKHIDGFCMWNTAETAFNVMNTPYGRDTLKMLAEACHRRRVPLCLYYSIVDENQPNYPNSGRPYELPRPEAGDAPDEGRYLEFVRRQVRELCTNYGEIHGFWWDANSLKHRDPGFNRLIRSLQPKAVINNRGFDEGDFSTPERNWDSSVNSKLYFDTPVEACESAGYQSWGYREGEDYHSDEYLIRNIQKVLAKNGNYLLNVGPNADGTIPEEPAGILRRIGKWYRAVKESLVGVEPAGELTSNRDVALTRRGNVVYVHLIREPETSSVFLAPMESAPRRATLLNTGEAIRFDAELLPRFLKPHPRTLRLKDLPVNARSTAGWVVKLEFEGAGPAAD